MPRIALLAKAMPHSRRGTAGLLMLLLATSAAPAQDPPAEAPPSAEDSASALPIYDLSTCEGLQAYRAAGARLSVAQAMDLTSCVTTPGYQPSGNWQGFTASRPPGSFRGDPYGLSTFGDWSTIDRIDG